MLVPTAAVKRNSFQFTTRGGLLLLQLLTIFGPALASFRCSSHSSRRSLTGVPVI